MWRHYWSKEESPGWLWGEGQEVETQRSKGGREPTLQETVSQVTEKEKEQHLEWRVERSLQRSRACGVKARHLGGHWRPSLGYQSNFFFVSFPPAFFFSQSPRISVRKVFSFYFQCNQFAYRSAFQLFCISPCVWVKYMHSFINSAKILSAYSQPGIVPSWTRLITYPFSCSLCHQGEILN